MFLGRTLYVPKVISFDTLSAWETLNPNKIKTIQTIINKRR